VTPTDRREPHERVASRAVELRDPEHDPRIARLLQEGPAATCFLPVPAGSVRMGSTLRADEQPLVEVEIAAFSCALTPVSNAEWAPFLAESGRAPSAFWEDERFSHPAQPVVGVSWEDAVAYCEWLSTLLGQRCRLPSEAEREHAARGGAATLYPWGDEPWAEGPFARGARGTDRPLPIGSTPPNGLGLYHMAENVHEWCADWYDPRAYEAIAAYADGRWHSPAEGSSRRASRGGSWRHHLKVSRVAARSSLRPDASYNDYGMRVYV
jgi:formylglycine-generating enzyme required for sulfatase activity